MGHHPPRMAPPTSQSPSATPPPPAPATPGAAIDVPPAGRVSIWPVVLLIFVNLFNYLDRTTMAAITLPVMREFNATGAQIGWLATGFLITYMLVAPLFGIWADRVSRWRLIGISLIIQSLASGGSGLAGTYLTLLVMRCSVGVGEAAYGPAAPALLSDMFPVAKRGRILAIFYTAIPVGSALGYVIGGAMLELKGDWRWAFYVLTPPGIVLGLLCFLMRDPPRSVAAGTPVKPTLRDYAAIVRVPSYVINCIGMTMMTFAIGGISQWMPTYLERDRGISTTHATATFGALSAAAGFLGTICGGVIGDRLRTRFAGSYFHVSGAGMLLGFPFFLLFFVTPFPYAWAVLFVAVFCLFLNTGPGNTILANVVPANVRASAFALNILMVHLFGDAISPPLIGYIADGARTPTSSGLGTGFFWTSILLAIGGVVWWSGARFLERDTQRATAAERASPNRTVLATP